MKVKDTWSRVGLLLGIVFIFSVSSITAQNYKSAAGARLGSPISLSFKTFLNEKNAVEAYVGFRGYSSSSRWISINGAYLIHRPLDDILDRLQWYAGGGASVYFWSSDFSTDGLTWVGLQGYIGLDYTIEKTPVNITIDWSPSIFLGNGFLTGFGGGYYALGVRYILGE